MLILIFFVLGSEKNDVCFSMESGRGKTNDLVSIVLVKIEVFYKLISLIFGSLIFMCFLVFTLHIHFQLPGIAKGICRKEYFSSPILLEIFGSLAILEISFGFLIFLQGSWYGSLGFHKVFGISQYFLRFFSGVALRVS